MREIKKDSADITVYFKMVDSASGVPEIGLTITDIDITYVRNRATAVKADLTELTDVDGSHENNKGKEVDSTNAKGLYRTDFPDEAFATGVDDVILIAQCTGCDPAMIEIDLVDNIAKDSYDIVSSATYGNAKLVRSTTPANTLDVSNTGEAGIDFDNIKVASGATTITNITIPTVSALTGHTGQSGDGYAVVNHTDHGNAKLVRSTTPANKLDVSNTGEAGLDFANIKDAGGAHTLTNITVPTVTTTGTASTVTNGAKSAELAKVPKSDSNVVWNATAQTTIQTKAAAALTAYNPPTRAEATSDKAAIITEVDANETKIDTLTATVGTAGAGLTNIGMFSQSNTELATVPTTVSSLKLMIQFLFEYFRNKKTVTATTETLFKEDASTSLGTATVGKTVTTFTKGEMS